MNSAIIIAVRMHSAKDIPWWIDESESHGISASICYDARENITIWSAQKDSIAIVCMGIDGASSDIVRSFYKYSYAAVSIRKYTW